VPNVVASRATFAMRHRQPLRVLSHIEAGDLMTGQLLPRKTVVGENVRGVQLVRLLNRTIPVHRSRREADVRLLGLCFSLVASFPRFSIMRIRCMEWFT